MTSGAVVHVPLAEIADIIRGVTFRKQDVSETDAPDLTPIIRAGNIGNELELDQDLIWVPTIMVSPIQLMRLGDIAMCASSGSSKIVGKSALLRRKWRGSVGAFCVIIRSKSEYCNHDFLAFFLRSAKFREWTRNAAGASIKNIRKSELESFVVPLPPLDEQRRIVDILNRATKIERLRAQAANCLRDLIPALFVRMFGDPVENPRGWEMRRMGDLSSVGSGTGFPKKEQGVHGEEFPFLKVSDMNLPGNEIVIRDWNNSVSDNTREELRAKIFPAGSIIFPKIGAAIATNKKRILVRPSCIDNNVMAIIPDSKLDSEYLFGLMLHKNLSDFASDADPPSMRKTTVEDWRIPCPPMSEQLKYSKLTESARATNQLADSCYRTTTALSASLMNRFLDAAA